MEFLPPLLVNVSARHVHVTQADLEEQFDLSLKVSQASIEARNLLARLGEVRDSLPSDADDARTRLDVLEAELVTGTVRYSVPMLIDQLQYLNGMVSRARPSADRYRCTSSERLLSCPGVKLTGRLLANTRPARSRAPRVRMAADVPGRGRYFRVRIGPFDSRREALDYQRKFETDERMHTLVVRNPDAS